MLNGTPVLVIMTRVEVWTGDCTIDRGLWLPSDHRPDCNRASVACLVGVAILLQLPVASPMVIAAAACVESLAAWRALCQACLSVTSFSDVGHYGCIRNEMMSAMS